MKNVLFLFNKLENYRNSNSDVIFEFWKSKRMNSINGNYNYSWLIIEKTNNIPNINKFINNKYYI